MIAGSGFDIKCPSCGGRYHETREVFDDQKLPTGDMFSLKPRYRKFAWTSFPERENIKLADLRCPWCDGGYLIQSRVARLVDQETGEIMRKNHFRRSPPPSGQATVGLPAFETRGTAEVILAEDPDPRTHYGAVRATGKTASQSGKKKGKR